jgi:hypothetical protein
MHSPYVEAMIFVKGGFVQCGGGVDCHYSSSCSGNSRSRLWPTCWSTLMYRELVIGGHRLSQARVGGVAKGLGRCACGRIGPAGAGCHQGSSHGHARQHARSGGTRAALSASQGFPPDYAAWCIPQFWRRQLSLEWRALHGIAGSVGKERKNPLGLFLGRNPAPIGKTVGT